MKYNYDDPICLIDDDPIFLFTVKQLLSKYGIKNKVLEFNNGAKAVQGLSERLQKQLPMPCMILLDINMPIMDGHEFLEEYNHLPITSTIPIYMLTSSIDEKDKHRAMSSPHLTDFLTKPLHLETFKKIFTPD